MVRRTPVPACSEAVTESNAVAERSAEALAYNNGRRMLGSHIGSQSGARGQPDSLALRASCGAERTRLLRHWPADALPVYLARAIQFREVVDARALVGHLRTRSSEQSSDRDGRGGEGSTATAPTAS